jgi:hypothetical protein
MSPSKTPTLTPTAETSPAPADVPQAILGPILNEASTLARVPPEQLAIIRAQAVIWNDGSLGCPERGMEYTQALVNGYWIVIKAGANVRLPRRPRRQVPFVPGG